MILMALFTTFITTPVVIAVYKPAKRKSKGDNYKYRTIHQNTELRMLVCFHSTSNIPTMINLVEVSRGTTGKREGLCVYAMHLMELTERSSAILMVHKARKNGLPFWNKVLPSGSNQVIVAFEAFGQLSRVFVRPMTAISAMSDIHEDICTSAERKRAAIIILPFHKHQRLDGTLESSRSEYGTVNRKVLEHAPCSVGILVDRGLGGTAQVSASNVSSIITVLFFGGCDDREALSYGTRMAEHPGISLVVIRLLTHSDDTNSLLDENFLAEFKQNSSLNNSVKYEERFVKNAAEAIEIIREYHRSTMFVVGRMPEGDVIALLSLKTEFPELGPVGSLLTSPDFPTAASVLVLQQHQPGSFPN